MSEGRPLRTTTGSEVVAGMGHRLDVVGVVANGVGAAVVFVFLAFLLPISIEDVDAGPVVVRNTVAAGLYLVMAFAVGTLWGRRQGALVSRWLLEERPPTDRERKQALRYPLSLVGTSAVLWVGAAVAFAALNAGVALRLAVIVPVTILLGGLSTCALVYLLAERQLRAVVGMALAGGEAPRPAVPGIAVRVVLTWALATGVPLLGIVALAVDGLAGDVDAGEMAAAVLFLAVVALGVGLAGLTYAARSVSEPIADLRAALARVGDADLTVRVAVDDASEVGLLQDGFNRMVAGLAEREQLRDLFGRHVGRDVVRAALAEGVALGGEEREVAALFVDVVGSTALAAHRPATEVVGVLNRFFAVVVAVVEEHGGMVNKFEGDAALCVFGAPVALEDPAAHGLAAARALAARLGLQVPEIDVGIGVSAGAAVAGNVGAEERFEYTIIGDPVNEAARLCELAKGAPGRVLASERALLAAGEQEAHRWRLGEPVTLRGRSGPTRLATPAPTG
jgi:adenylate cyclase